MDTHFNLISCHRFDPLDAVLVKNYLLPFISGQPLPSNAVTVKDLSSQEPWLLTGAGENEHARIANPRYYFVLRKLKYAKGSIVDRCAGAGTWKSTQVPKKVVDEDGVVLAEKRAFTYCYTPQGRGRQDADKKTHWLMYEYEPKMKGSKFQEWVVCKIKCRHVANCNMDDSGLETIHAVKNVDDTYGKINMIEDKIKCRHMNNDNMNNSGLRTIHAVKNVDDDINLLPPSWQQTIPVGYMFRPTIYELVQFLCLKLGNNPCTTIEDGDVYNTEPWILTGAGDKNAPMDERYFFAVRTKVKDGDDGMNTSRSAGIGYWKISSTKKVVDESGKQLIGHLASLKYIIKRERKDLAAPKSPLKLKGEEEKTQENSSNDNKMKINPWEKTEKVMHDDEKTNWVMQELTLRLANEGNRFQKLAICKIRHREVAERAMVNKHEEERPNNQKANDISKKDVQDECFTLNEALTSTTAIVEHLSPLAQSPNHIVHDYIEAPVCVQSTYNVGSMITAMPSILQEANSMIQSDHELILSSSTQLYCDIDFKICLPVLAAAQDSQIIEGYCHSEELPNDVATVPPISMESQEIRYQEERHHVELNCVDGSRAPTVSSTRHAETQSQQNCDMLLDKWIGFYQDMSLFKNGLHSDLISNGELLDHVDNYLNVSWTMDDRYKDLDDLILDDGEGDQDQKILKRSRKEEAGR